MPNPNKENKDVRLDRHSGTGRRGLPKKEGFGKHGWGRPDDPTEEFEADHVLEEEYEEDEVLEEEKVQTDA